MATIVEGQEPKDRNDNPANTRDRKTEGQKRVPMSVPHARLAVPAIPGYICYWMLGTPERLHQAQKAGYEFVDEDEVDIYNSGIANDAESSGNSDMGTRISVPASPNDAESNGLRLFLMKIREEWYAEDRELLEERSENIARALRGGQDLSGRAKDPAHTYIPEAHQKGVANLFMPKNRRS